MSKEDQRHYTDYIEWKDFPNFTEVVGWLEEHMDDLFHYDADSKKIRFGFDSEENLGFFLLTWYELFKKTEDDDAFGLNDLFKKPTSSTQSHRPKRNGQVV